MSAAERCFQFNPMLRPAGQVVYHLWGDAGDEHPDEHTRAWVVRTACGRVAYANLRITKDDGSTRFVTQEPGTWTRLDHAQLLGPLCRHCDRDLL